MNTSLFSLEGKIALVTGASSGIGYTLAKGLANAGATVAACARRSDRLQELVEEIKLVGGNAVAIPMDVTDSLSIEKAFEQSEKHLGVCDIIINNAGVANPKHFLKIDTQAFEQVFNTNFRRVWLVAQEASKRMIAAQKPGSIINIASILGLNVKPGQSTYCASKAAVIQLTKSLALDLSRYNIRVNAIAPGWFKTEMNKDYFDTKQGQQYIEQMPAERLGQLEELIGPVIMLASEAGSFVNGVTLPVDGAHHIRLI